MTKKESSIYKNSSINSNNKKAYYSFNKNNEDYRQIEEIKKTTIKSIEELFNKKVEITTRDFKIVTTIISKLNDHILTSDNRIIELSDIREINPK